MLSILFALTLAFQGQESGQGRAGGSHILQGDFSTAPPQVLQKFDPEYTQEALDAKLQGTVTLSVVITPEGKASQINVAGSLGMGLDQKAVECVEKWRFRPGMRNGEPVAVRANIEINFRLPR
jgi:periplasmic protein TonB